mmetsp:Transcript_8451/g.11011  ORF Transcript_8451/g.11011 Transcript_8451/m.11011 type:complete len:612 (+) Transcript_8451:136-1971(+)
MEFERALFRVYDRSLESLRANQPCSPGSRLRPLSICHIIELMLLSLIIFLFILLGTLHTNFVGEYAPKCLHSELKYQKELEQLLWIPEDHPNKTTPEYPLLGKNVILQIGFGNKGTKERLKYMNEIYGENATMLNGAGDGEFKKQYRFTENPPLLYLNKPFIKNHDIQTMNITISRDCLSRNSMFLDAAISLVGYDTIIINQLFSVGAGGVLENSKTGEEWGWNKGFVPPKHGYSFGDSIGLKFAVLLQTCFAFFFVATVTSLIVRMLISSGVVVMFPLFWMLQMLGFRDLDMHILTLSYPWLGLPVEVLRRMGKPSGPLIAAHVFRVIVLYSMYEACQLAWSVWFYDKPLPDGLQLEVFAIVMIWEYFAMIYLRSASAIYFLPKFTLLYFIGFHVYFYGHAYAFFGVALLIFYLLVAHSLLATIVHFEVQAAERLEITFDNPRAYFVELPWQAWQASLPPSWTLFMPLNARRRNIYDDTTTNQTQPNNGDQTTMDDHAQEDSDANNDQGGGGLQQGSDDMEDGGVEMQSMGGLGNGGGGGSGGRSSLSSEGSGGNMNHRNDDQNERLQQHRDEDEDEEELTSLRRNKNNRRPGRRNGGNGVNYDLINENP